MIRANNKRIANNTVYLYLRMLITMAVSLYTVRVVFNVLTAQDYGLYSAVGGIILTFTFISSVLDNASQRFFSFELGRGLEGHLRETFSTIIIIYVLVSIVVVIIAETIGIWFVNNKMIIPTGRESAATWVFQFALASFIVTITATPYRAMIIAQERMNLYAYISIFDAISKLLIAYLLMVFAVDKLKLYAVLLFFFNLISNFIYFIYCYNKYHEVHFKWHFDKTMFKSIFSYSSWTLFGTLSSMCNTQGVNIVLNMFFGPVANAAYSIASQVYHTVGTFGSNFYVAVKPQMIKSYASNNYGYVLKLFTFSSKTLFALICVIAIPLMVYSTEILGLWLGSIGDYMVSFVKLSLIYVTILTVSYPITAIVQATGQVKLYHSLVDGFSLISLPIIYFLFRLGFAAHWAYIISILVFSIAHSLRIFVMKKVFPVFDIRKYVAELIVPMTFIFVVGYSISRYCKVFIPDHFVSTIMGLFFTILLVLALCFIILYNKSEREMVWELIKSWGIKGKNVQQQNN